MLAGWCYLTVGQAATRPALPTKSSTTFSTSPTSEGVALVSPQSQEASRSIAATDGEPEALDPATRVALLEDEVERLKEVNRLLESRVRDLETSARTASVDADAKLLSIADDLHMALEANRPTTFTSVRFHDRH